MTFGGQTIPQTSPYAGLEDQFEELMIAVAETVKSGHYILGGEVRAFELEWSSYCDVSDCVGVANGTDAITLALQANDIGPGDEVITVGNAGVPTCNAILATGAKPVIIDVNDRLLMDWRLIEEALTMSTRAIVPVHLYGNVCDMFNINSVAYKYGLCVIEDCSQAHGAKVNAENSVGQSCGTWSFYPTKNLGAFGDAGAITTSSKMVANRLFRLRQYGWDNGRLSLSLGTNSRMDEIQAAVLRKKLEVLDVQNWRRQEIADRYAQVCDDFGIGYVIPSKYSAHHQFVVLDDDRAGLKALFNEYGVRTAIHYALPIYEHPYYKGRVRVYSFQKTDYYCNRILSIPMYAQLSIEQVERVCDVLKCSRSGAMPCTQRIFT